MTTEAQKTISNKSELEAELSKVLGCKTFINDEYGIYVFNEFMQPLLSVSTLPKKTLTAAWILNKITSKDANAAKLKARREAGIAKIKEGLKKAGVMEYALYATSFGFSVCNLFGDGIAKTKEIVEKCGIEAKRIEYSDAHWVVRVIL